MDALSMIFTIDFVKQILVVVLLVLSDLGFGIAVAVKSGTFDFAKLANFYKTTVLGLVLGWLVFVFMVRVVDVFQLADFLPDELQNGALGLIQTAAFVFLGATLVSGLIEKVKELFGQVPGRKA